MLSLLDRLNRPTQLFNRKDPKAQDTQVEEDTSPSARRAVLHGMASTVLTSLAAPVAWTDEALGHRVGLLSKAHGALAHLAEEFRGEQESEEDSAVGTPTLETTRSAPEPTRSNLGMDAARSAADDTPELATTSLDLPIEDYDALNVHKVVHAIKVLDIPQLKQLMAYEETHKNRKSALQPMERLLTRLETPTDQG